MRSMWSRLATVDCGGMFSHTLFFAESDSLGKLQLYLVIFCNPDIYLRLGWHALDRAQSGINGRSICL